MHHLVVFPHPPGIISLIIFCGFCLIWFTDCVWPVAQQPGYGVERCWSAAVASVAGSTELHWAASVTPAVPGNILKSTDNSIYTIQDNSSHRVALTWISDLNYTSIWLLAEFTVALWPTCTACLSYRDIWAIWGGREFPPDAALLLAELELVWSSPASMLTGWTTSQSNFVIEYQRKICINKRFRRGLMLSCFIKY